MLEPILIAAALLAAVYFAGWWQGSSGRRELQAQIEASIEKRRADIADLVVGFSNRDIAAKEQARLQDQRRQLATTSQKTQVRTYVPPIVDAAVPSGFVLLHDAAWRGTPLPDPPQGIDPWKAPQGPPLSQIAEVTVDNAGACLALLDEIERCEAGTPTPARAGMLSREELKQNLRSGHSDHHDEDAIRGLLPGRRRIPDNARRDDRKA